MADPKIIDIIGIIGPGGSGGTFLDWTLHYLAGDINLTYVLFHRKHKIFQKVLTQKIVENPIRSDGNSHLHQKTHPTEEVIKICIDNLRANTDENINVYSMFIAPDSESYSNTRSYTTIVKDIAEKHTEMKLIHFIYSEKSIEDLAQRMLTKIPNLMPKEDFNSLRTKILNESLKANKIINMANIYPLNIDTMFYNLDSEIRKIFNWLSLPINEERYNSWLDVYKQWQLAQNFYTTIQN